jgi:class 3 adenylate cyclase/Tfp pilus assembly protein PilF
MKYTLIRVMLICVLGVSCLRANATGNDSLINALKKEMTDTDRVKLLLAINESLDCSDTNSKNKYILQAEELSQKIDWAYGTIFSYEAFGELYNVCKRDYDKSIIYFQKAEAGAKEDNLFSIEAREMRYIAFVYRSTTQYDKAIDKYRQSIEIEPDKETNAGTFATIGTIFNNLGDYTTALQYYQDALKTLQEYLKQAKEISEDDISMKCGLLITTGDINTAISQYDKALANYDSAIKLSVKIKTVYNNGLIKTWALKSKGHLYQQERDYEAAIQNYREALNNYAHDLEDKGEILNALGEIYFAKGETDTAMGYAERSKELFEKVINENGSLDLAAGLANTYITLGKIYIANKKNRLAVDNLKRALDMAIKTGAVDKQSDAWLQLSNAYDSLQEPQKALEAHRNFVKMKDSVFSIDKAKAIALLQVKDEVAKDSLKQEEARKVLGFKLQKQRLFTYSGFAGVCMVLLLAFFIFRSYSNEKKAKDLIQYEKKKSDDLLLNILPVEVADELKDHGSVNVKEFEMVTVLFTDFVKFTKAAERLSAEQLVKELDVCFAAFDGIITKYNVEKIKTIGDAYMAASGLPQPDSDHAEHMIRAALEIRDFMLQRKAALGDRTFEVRIGIHSGPAIAGVVGVKKFAYDIWGDTVNVAARMEQSSVPGKVNISDVTYALVKDKFKYSYRGEIEAKNKGMMKMYFVE